MSWFKRLKDGLLKTSSSITEGIAKVFTHTKLDQEALDALEESLIKTDLGAVFAAEIVAELSKEKFNKQATEEEIRDFLALRINAKLAPATKPLVISGSPHVILFVGVNGNGKTTTLGKLALKYKKEGKKVLIAACDTFRAAAISQLEVWADRANCPIIKGAENSDPAAVAYKAIETAKAEGFDVLLIDTAGRLHNKTNLMEELAKIVRVINKLDSEAPHTTLLVLDATTGQNAIAQTETFLELVKVSGLIVTKLDGTAKGGVLVAIAKKFNLPIHFIGVGESIDDLHEFDAGEFSKALVGN